MQFDRKQSGNNFIEEKGKISRHFEKERASKMKMVLQISKSSIRSPRLKRGSKPSEKYPIYIPQVKKI